MLLDGCFSPNTVTRNSSIGSEREAYRRDTFQLRMHTLSLFLQMIGGGDHMELYRMTTKLVPAFVAGENDLDRKLKQSVEKRRVGDPDDVQDPLRAT